MINRRFLFVTRVYLDISNTDGVGGFVMTVIYTRRPYQVRKSRNKQPLLSLIGNKLWKDFRPVLKVRCRVFGVRMSDSCGIEVFSLKWIS